MQNIKNGTIIKSENWEESIEINFIEERGEYIRIVGCTTISREHIDQLVSYDEFTKYIISQSDKYFTEDAWKVFLALETIRYRFASLYDPLLAMNTSKIDPLPHQIEAVYNYVLKLPRIRFLIADDPGAGKTIMAGLIIKELKLRHLVQRILIVSPGHLKDQWRRELSERFDEKFFVIDRNIIDALYGENVWQRENQVITSIDFAKREEILPSLACINFDLIIVDEAHKMSAYRYGDKTSKTSRYKLGEKLSDIAEHLLFLTATPHKGDSENFRLFLDLLEPGFFATNKMLEESIQNKDNPLFLRRIKEDLKAFNGTPLFLPRYVQTIAFNIGIKSPREKDLYNGLSEYVKNQYNKALDNKDKRKNVAFALVILQRRFSSSTYALFKSLERRKKRLEELMQLTDKPKIANDTFDFETIEDMSENERWEKEQIWETLSLSENKEELQKEIKIISDLIKQAEIIIQNEEELKLSELRKTLQELSQVYSEPKDKKILIFTESKDTLEYLEKKIQNWAYKTNVIHGGMRLDDRIKAEKIFKNETDILIATEAAGEGINLQFCHLMINYDIPWNPNRLEQRMGRIHRYGQQKEVFIYNLVAEDTREGQVLNKLFAKLEEIKTALGSDKVFDVLGEVLTDTNLSQLLIEAAANARDIDEILKEIDIFVDENYIAKIKDNLGDSLATRFIDYTGIKELEQKAKENRLIPEYTESFFKKAFIKAEGKIKELQNGFLTIESIPFDIRKIAEQDTIKKSYGELLKKYPKVTFDKDIAFKNTDAEFISFGHPLFEALMVWIERKFLSAIQNGAVFIDPDGKLDGYILIYEGEIKDGTNMIAGKRLFGFYISNDQATIPIPLSIIWDLKESEDIAGETIDIDELKKTAEQLCIKILQDYKQELLQERQRQTQIKQNYGVKSLEYLILKLDGDLISLYERRDNGENVDLAIRNKEERKECYEKALKDLETLIKKEKNLIMNMPHFRGIIRVKPEIKRAKAMKSNDEIEKIGMEQTIKYEIENERMPEDVSSDNLGFDIRSQEKNSDYRYIEVKARAEMGEVALTQNEWFKAKQFKNSYYLYVVFNAGTKPELLIIQNPAENLHPEVEVVRFIVSEEEVIEKAEIV